jgi:hypothetical protein
VVGGISPLGQRKHPRTSMDASAPLLDEIVVKAEGMLDGAGSLSQYSATVSFATTQARGIFDFRGGGAAAGRKTGATTS